MSRRRHFTRIIQIDFIIVEIVKMTSKVSRSHRTPTLYILTGLNSGRCYSEVREYYKRETNTMIVFKFINRVSPAANQPWTEEIEIRLGQRKIDILLVGSSIWDIKRYKDYIRFFFRSVRS